MPGVGARPFGATLAVVMLAAIAFAPTTVAQQERRRADPDSPRMKGVEAFAAFLTTEDEVAVADFIAEHVAASVRDAMGDTALAEELAAVREELRGATRSILRPQGELSVSISYTLPGGAAAVVTITLDDETPERFTAIITPTHRVEA